MTNLQAIHRIVRFAVRRRMLGSAVVLFLLAGQMNAQTSATDTRTPAGLTPGSPSGTYALSEFDNVNLYTGGLSFHLPLLKVGGRGGASYTMTLPIEQIWRVNHDFASQGQHWPNHNWWTGLRPGYGPGVLQGRQTHEGCGDGGPWPGGEAQTGSMTTLTFTTPDGTEYEFRDELTGGNRLVSTCCCYYQQHANGASRGTVFKTFDGSAATFISDTTIYDWSGGIESGPHMIYPSGYLVLRDGTRYRIESGQVIWIRDRNGNKLNFQGGIIDSNGRTITVEHNVNDPTYGLCDRVTFKGAGGATRRIWITKTTLSNVLRNTQPYDITAPQTYAALFDYLTGSSYTQHNPSGAVSSVVLPDGRRYQFFYNTYSELARVVLPTGGAIEYDWNHGGGGSICGSGPEIQRRVTERRVYSDGSILQGKTTYEGWDLVSRDANGTAIARSKHYFHAPTMACPSSISHNQWNEGRQYQTEEYTANGATLLKRINHTWQQTAPSWHSSWTFEAANNPKLVATLTAIEPNGANVVTKTTAVNPQTGAIGFDQYNNQTDIWEYDFGAGAPGSLLRHTHTDFLTVHPVSGSNYAADANIHLRGLPTQASVYDASGVERSRSTFEYDNYASDTNHAPLVHRASISGFDPAFSTSYLARGNLTGTTRYLLTNGSVNGSTSAFAQYDIAGNAIKSIDGRGYATTFDFSDRYGAPDGEARGNAGSAELNGAGQYSYAFPTLVTNALGHTAYLQFDYYIGQPVDGEDANGVVASGYFNDALDRPTQIIRAANQGASVKSQTTFGYDDINRVITNTSDQNTFGDNLLKSQIVYDGLGRTTDKRQYESVSAYITVRQTYDALGRGYQTSNPFRAGESIVWTTTAYDALSRVTSVTTPDNAVVGSSYWGNTVTVTDQAGKQRKSQTDGLGRLVHVYEDPNGLNYITSYAYDSLDSLTNVYQGSQTRTFVYDSLKRLTSATNPESGTVTYSYDENGNLRFRTDARGVLTDFRYDALNRLTTKLYRINNQPDPNTGDVEYLYDNATNGKGRPWLTFTYGAAPFQTAVGGYDAMGRVTQLYRMFGNGSGGYHPSYGISAAYNQAGALTTMTYPSGRTVTNSYDGAGRLSSFTGYLGDGTQRNYATGLSYSPFGGLTQEQFGTNTPLYNKKHYNVRGQLYDIRVSTLSLAQNEFDWNRGCLALYYGGAGWGQSSATNNGNVTAQQHWAPLNEAISDYGYAQQGYSYDALNRLENVSEVHGGPWGQSGTDFAQVFTYDRYGNRTINDATWGAPEPQFGVDVATNRLTPPGGYTMSYDAAGNLTNDTYTGQGARTYNAENKIKQAWANSQWQTYWYDGDGDRIKRIVNGTQTWQVYGIGGELLAEYAPVGSPATPQKEYGYRNGELLITADGRTNVALAANGGVASASTAHTCCGFSVGGAINGNTTGPWGNGEGWNDATPNELPDWFQVDFAGSKTINEIDVFSLHDDYTQPNTPTETQTFSLYGLVNFELQYWNGSAWATIPGGNVSGNNKVWRKFTFAPITTSKIRLWITGAPDGWSRLVEIQAYEAAGGGGSQNVTWTNASGVTVNGNSLTKTAGAGWGNAGAASTQTIASGDGYVEFTASETTTYRMLGLSNGDSNQDYSDIDFAIYPAEGAGLHVYEGGVYRGTFGSYTTGDVLRVDVEGGVVKYKKNGVMFYTSTVTPSYPLLVDTSLYSNGSTISNVVMSSGGGGGGSSATVKWLVADHLGTPRMVFNQTGALANVSRHDYLPFGEELYAGTSGRTAGLGYTANDGVRQKFTKKERDNETGLDYFLARYYSSTQGRFTSSDPGSFVPADPQNWNRYSYTQSNPLKFTDPTGEELYITGTYADELMADLSRWTGYKLLRDPKTGKVTRDPKDKTRQTKGTSFNLALLVSTVIKDEKATVKMSAVSEQNSGVGILVDSFILKSVDIDDHRAMKSTNSELAASALGHAIAEYYEDAQMQCQMNPSKNYPPSHRTALEWESAIMSDFNGYWQAPRTDQLLNPKTPQPTLRVIYSTVQYDILLKTGATGRPTQMSSIQKVPK